jgi:hypothetical protein
VISDGYAGEVLKRLHGEDGKPDRALDALGGSEYASLLGKVRTARLQSLATRAAHAFLNRAADEKAGKGRAFEPAVAGVLEAAAKLPATRELDAPDPTQPKVRLEARYTRGFREKLEEHLAAVEDFAGAYAEGTPTPMLDAESSSGLLTRRAGEKRAEFRSAFVRFWREMHERIERDVPDRIRRVADWAEFRRLCEGQFGFAETPGGLPAHIHSLVQVCAGNIDAEKDAAWLSSANPDFLKYLERFGGSDWMRGYDEILPAFRAFRDAALQLPGDPVEACRRLADKDKGEELRKPLFGLDKIASRFENSRPFRAVDAVNKHARAVLAGEVNRRFEEEWGSLQAKAYRAGGWCRKFPFAPDPMAPDATAADALEFLGRESDVGKALLKFEPLFETEKSSGFPFVLRADNPRRKLDRQFASAWREWRDFLFDEKEPGVIRKFEAVKLVINEGADVSKFAPNSFLKQITRLRVKVGAQKEFFYDTSLPEKREFPIPFAPQTEFGTFELKYDSENADFINSRQTVWPPDATGAAQRQPGAWILLRYLREAGPTRTRTEDGRSWFVYHVMTGGGDARSYAFRLDLVFPAPVPGPFPDRKP